MLRKVAKRSRTNLIRLAQISKPIQLAWSEPSDEVAKRFRKVANQPSYNRFRSVKRPNWIPPELPMMQRKGFERLRIDLIRSVQISKQIQLDRPKPSELVSGRLRTVSGILIRLGCIARPNQLDQSEPNDGVAKRLRKIAKRLRMYRIDLIRSAQLSKPTKLDRSGAYEGIVESLRKVSNRSNQDGLTL